MSVRSNYYANLFCIFLSYTDCHVHSFGGPSEDPYITNCLHRIIDLEELDKETIHLLIFLFMQFLSRSDQAYPTEEKPLARIQSIVLRHLYLLLGYSQIDHTFHVTPCRLRASAVFNAFLSTLPQTLDQNHLMGWTLLPTALHVLLYSPSTSLVANANSESSPGIPYTYSLWRLEPHIRRNWLMSVEVIMYKVRNPIYLFTDPSANEKIGFNFGIVCVFGFFSTNTRSHRIVVTSIIWYE